MTNAQVEIGDSYTLEGILSTPFPYDLIASPSGTLVAWVFDERGARNIWAADPSRKASGKRITAYTGDNGSELGQLRWASGGEFICYSRGGSFGGGGPVNAMSLPDGAQPQEVWVVSANGGEPRLLGEGYAPSVSPKDDFVAFVRSDQIWLSRVSADLEPKQLIRDRGRCGSVVWSHDGSRIAFISVRHGRSTIGIYDFAHHTVVWASPSVDSDSSVVWAPDDSEIVFIRVPYSSQPPFMPRPYGTPWSIWAVDVRSGEGRRIWTADEGPGSVFRGLYSGASSVAQSLFWAADGRLLFPWERTGWRRLYSVPITGGPAELLTPGKSEIYNVAVSSDGLRAVYSSNVEGDADRLHLWEVTTSGGAPRQLTSGNRIDAYPILTADGSIVCLHSDAKLPVRPVVLRPDGATQDLVNNAVPEEFPFSKLVEPQPITFTSPDGLEVQGQLFVPSVGTVNARPAILYFHGGPYHQMLLGWHPREPYAYMYGLNQYLTNKGFIVLSVNFRGGIGYGLRFREADRFSAGGGSEVADIFGAIRFLINRIDVDPGRIGIYGMSYGGVMTGLGLSRASDQLAAGVDICGVHNWRTFIPELTAAGADPEAAKTAYNASPISMADEWRSPVLFIHADDDRAVPLSQTAEMIQALRARPTVEIEQLIIPNEVHNLTRHRNWMMILTATAEFFERRLLSTSAPA